MSDWLTLQTSQKDALGRISDWAMEHSVPGENLVAIFEAGMVAVGRVAPELIGRKGEAEPVRMTFPEWQEWKGRAEASGPLSRA